MLILHMHILRLKIVLQLYKIFKLPSLVKFESIDEQLIEASQNHEIGKCSINHLKEMEKMEEKDLNKIA